MTQPINATVLRISYESEDELDRKLAIIAHRRGFVMTKAAPERIDLQELARRVGRSTSTVCRSLGRPSCPPFESKKGKRRRVWIEPNERLMAFLKK